MSGHHVWKPSYFPSFSPELCASRSICKVNFPPEMSRRERKRAERKGRRAGAFPRFTKKEEEGVTESAKNLKERRSCV